MERNGQKRRVIVDIEANGLHPTKLWCLVAKDIDTLEIFKFKPSSPFSGHDDWKDDFLKFVPEVGTWIGHNLIGYDVPHMNRLLGTDIKVQDIVDTLVLSRLFRPVSPFKEQMRKLKGDTRLGGHSLDAWGARLKFPKIKFNQWDMYTEEMLEYCVRDVEVNHKVYDILETEKEGFSTYSIRLEHKVAHLLHLQQVNGFYLDQDKAKKLVEETEVLLAEMTKELHDIFPPIPKIVRARYIPKYNKDGEMSAVSTKILEKHKNQTDLVCEDNGNGSYDLGRLVPFNPGSGPQIAERLLGIGWSPKVFTDKKNPKTDKVTLADAIDELLIDNPEMQELRHLANYNIVADRNQKAKKWLELVEEDGRVHGNINPIGAGTHRCSHYNDNMANIASVTTRSSPISDFGIDFDFEQTFSRFDDNKILVHHDDKEVTYGVTGLDGYFGWDSRDCWSVPDLDKNVLVGADASGIQLRALAHYMNDTAYTTKLLKDDIHTVHQHAAGIATRPIAKTFIYAWLLGAGDEKIGLIVGVSPDEYEALFDYAEKVQVWGKPMLEYVVNSLRRKGRKATKKLTATIIKGFKVKEQFLDRTPALKHLKKVVIPEASKKGYLTGIDGRRLWIPSEHLAMSMYLQGFEAVIMKVAMCIYSKELEVLGIPFKQVGFVHDEFQIETKREFADIVGKTVVKAIVEAGEQMNSNCPLDGEYKVGNSWAQTH